MTARRREVVSRGGRWGFVALAAAIAGLLAAGEHLGTFAQQDRGPKPKKPGSGLSFFDRTTVSPEAAAAPSGFDNERVLSAYDDWEPAVATDAITSYVYQITTRHSSPAACTKCPFPELASRR